VVVVDRLPVCLCFSGFAQFGCGLTWSLGVGAVDHCGSDGFIQVVVVVVMAGVAPPW